MEKLCVRWNPIIWEVFLSLAWNNQWSYELMGRVIMLVLQRFNNISFCDLFWSCFGDLPKSLKIWFSCGFLWNWMRSNEFPNKQIAKMWSITITTLFLKQFITKSNWVLKYIVWRLWTFLLCSVMCLKIFFCKNFELMGFFAF